MAQPWAVIAGNTLSALIGISYFHLIADPLPLCSVPSHGGFSLIGFGWGGLRQSNW